MEAPRIAGIFIIFIFSLLTSHHVLAYDTHEAFLHCFHHQTLNTTTTQVLYTPNTTSFNTIYRSSLQNIRFLSTAYTKPALIVTPTAKSHVQASIICGRQHNLRIRVRSGGHDYEGLSYISDSGPFIVIDLVNFRSVDVDTGSNTAWVGAGATLGEVYYNISVSNGTAGFPAGVCPTVGVGGHLSGGGAGTLTRMYGMAADNIVDALLIDADGNLLNRESMGEDLFWAIRGGGAASFGVILSYKVNLVYVPPTVTVFSINKTLSQGATQLVDKWQLIAPKLNKKVFIRVIAEAVDDEKVPGNRTILASFRCLFLGRSDELLALMDHSFPELDVEVEDCHEMSWIETALNYAGYPNQSSTILLDRRPQFNSSFNGKSDFVTKPISQMGWKKIWKVLMEAEGETVQMILDPWGGKMDEISKSATPFPYRKGYLYNIQYFMRWFEGNETVTQRHLDWMRRFYSYMTPYVSKNPRASYLNYRDLDLGRNEEVGHGSYSEARVWGSKYFSTNFKRLAYVKGRVDPDNYFWNEQSIPPL